MVILLIQVTFDFHYYNLYSEHCSKMQGVSLYFNILAAVLVKFTKKL